MRLGRKLFYDNVTGLKIVDTGQWDNAIRLKTVEEDIATYKELSERNRDTFDVLELPYGAYAQDFIEGRLVGVDVETKVPVFEYPDPNAPDEPIVVKVPLSKEVIALKAENKMLKAQTQANADRADFQEEVITEIIMAIYA